MPRVADYFILSDTKFVITTFMKEKVFKFADAGLPSNVDSGSRSVLTFMIDSSGSLDDFKLRVQIGHIEVYSATFNGPHYHGVQEVLPKGLVNEGNTLEFLYMGGSGAIEISDVVVWVQVNV